MLSRGLRGILLFELVVSTLSAWAIGCGNLISCAVVIFFVMFLLVPLVASLLSPAIARRHGTPSGTAGGPTVAAVVAEWAAFVFLFGVVMPFECAFMGSDGIGRLPPGRRPVLLVPGYMCNRGLWWWARRRLRAAGHAVATVTLETPVSDIEHLADGLTRRVDDLLAETGADRVLLVGHSMGGLIARAFLARPGAASRVARFVTIAGPHRGTVLAPLGIGRDAAEMRRGSDFLEALARAPDPGVPTLVIRSDGDTIVVPPTSSCLEGAEEVVLPAIGHLSMVLSPAVIDRVVAELDRDALRGGARA